ncbi:MAG: hypothetical protein ACUVWN_17355 [bacterium]
MQILIENPQKRREMGLYGRRMLEEGRFSLKVRDEQLLRIFKETIE